VVKRIWGGLKRIALQQDTPALADEAPLFDHTVRWTDRLVSLTVLRLVVWVAVAAFVYQGVLSDAFKLTDWMDDHQFYSWEESDRMTLLRWHQLPAWNPYWCGGTVGAAAPEDPFFGPDFLLRIVFGVAHGRRLAIILLVVMGFEGMFRLCRRLDATVAGSVFAAVIFGTCDRFVPFIHDGWINFLGFELIPWVALCFLKGLESWRWRLLGGFFFAWIVLSAGTYPAPFAMLVIGYLSVAFSIRGLLKGKPGSRAWLTPWVTAITIGLVGLALSFGKLVPTLAFLRQFPRVFTPVEALAAPPLFINFYVKYSAVLLLGLIALVTADVVAGIFLGGMVFFFLMAMGDFGSYTPFHLLKLLPVFGQLRFPDRYMVLVLFFAAICGARGITRLEDTLPALVRGTWNRFRAWRKKDAREAPRELQWIAMGLATFAAYHYLRPPLEETLELVRIRPQQMYLQEAPRNYDQPFRQHRGNRRDAHMFPPMNMGSLYCVAGNPVPESPLLRADLPAEEYPVDPTKATVKRLSWSPNEITLEVDAREATTIHVNQNWAPEWRTDVGTVKSDDKLLAVDVPAGKNVVTLAYRDRALYACLLVSLVSLLGLVGFFARDGWRWLGGERKRWRTMPTWPDDTQGEAEEEPAEEPAEEEESVVEEKAEEPVVEKKAEEPVADEKAKEPPPKSEEPT
jgi:hypothetical protein